MRGAATGTQMDDLALGVPVDVLVQAHLASLAAHSRAPLPLDA